MRWISKRCDLEQPADRIAHASVPFWNAYSVKCVFAGSSSAAGVAPTDACTGVAGEKSNCTFDP